jgi:hypothetical protein
MNYNTYDIVAKGISKQNAINSKSLFEKIHNIITEFLSDVEAATQDKKDLESIEAFTDKKRVKRYETK